MTTKSIPYIGGKIEIVFNKADETPATIQIYDDIGKDPWTGEGFSAKDLSNALKEITPRNRELKINVNSRGGDVNEGKAIRSMLEDWPGRIVNVIDGVAASTASWMIPADEVQARNHSQIFIHKSWAMVVGNADDMGKAVAMLNTTDEQIADIYAKKTGKGRTAMMQLMADETLLTGQTAMELGLVDKLIDGDAVHNFSATELQNMKSKLAAMNSLKNISAPTQGADENKNKEQEKRMEKTPEALPIEQAKHENKEVIELKNELTKMKNLRIADKFNDLAKTRPQLAEKREAYIANCQRDEAFLETYAAFPESPEPINHASRIVVGTNPLLAEYNKLTPGAARSDFRANNFDALQLVAPKNANTFGSSLIPDSLADAIVTVAHNKLAFLNAFSTDFGTDAMRPKATVQVPKATAGATAQSDATNFESGDSTLTNIAVSVAQKSVSFHISNGQYNQGFRLNQIAQINANVMADTISDVVTALMLTGTYGAATVIGAAASFDSADLPPIYAVAKNYNRKNLILDGGHLAYLLPTNKWQFALGEQGAFGFDLIAENNRWTSATANTVGFICDPSAIAVASGLPMTSAPSGEFVSQSTVSLKNGLTVQINVWFSRSSRTLWASYDVMFGAAAGDTTAAKLLVTA